MRGVKLLNTNKRTRQVHTTVQENQLVAETTVTGSAATVTGGGELGVVVGPGNTLETKEL